nr:DUF302 domain-containing protein [Aromatoleum diolicum]
MRAGCIFLVATLLATTTQAIAAGPEVIVLELSPLAYGDARNALQDAMTDEGLAPPSISEFGQMLARTAKDLGHRADFYKQAEIFSFCSAQVSARMIAEDVRHIALCPLTIALYTLPGQAGTVFLAYRAPDLASPAGDFARAMLRRIAARTLEHAGVGR